MKIAINIPNELMEAFDKKAKEEGYKSRNKAIQELMHEYVGR